MSSDRRQQYGYPEGMLWVWRTNRWKALKGVKRRRNQSGITLPFIYEKVISKVGQKFEEANSSFDSARTVVQAWRELFHRQDIIDTYFICLQRYSQYSLMVSCVSKLVSTWMSELRGETLAALLNPVKWEQKLFEGNKEACVSHKHQQHVP